MMREKRFKKVWLMVCAAAMLLAATGCGGTASSASTADSAVSAAASVAEADPGANVQVGQVTAITGSTVTLTLGELTGGGPDGEPPAVQAPGGDGTAPEKPADDASAPSDAGQAAPEGEDNQPANDGAPPDGSDANGPGSAMGRFTAGTENVSYDLSAAAITRGAADASVSDIAVDDLLTLTLDDNGTVTAVRIESLESMESPDPGTASGSDS